MAYHGGRTSLPRAHRPRAPIMSVPAPMTAPLAPLRQVQQQQQQQQHPSSAQVPQQLQQHQSGGGGGGGGGGNSGLPQVSLSAPRPDCERTTNEYVETPFRVQPFVPPASPPPPPRAQRPTRLPISPPVLQPITKQPAATASFTKPLPPAECNSRQSIICSECGNCRCTSCQQPKPLPECWLCEEKCLCSANTIIDYASCLCCVKGLFYHCSESDGGTSCADNPCACGPDRRTARWGCLAALSCLLPCLWLYWPLQCGKRAVEACYARHSRQGCKCRPKNTPHLNTPEKRLLDASSDF
ncbi:PREDICTED: protein sprouty [Nicrophorus vespilloides]|uniref:Protein sprouty n=1 Tax=Nicrophorus vespilloides TaxID=110193 RepID=A0ABM1NAU2_NICVS|nr:PREDICTED: protein sprouty [Nicrophorus vespilloides]XP_017783941.1 PREDICTED: protein sprouty [Nicrophorus vespilloides]XP_017783942.1 PREDICTED: protein sprouty [Nicrophorus vespilloides]